MDNDIFYEFSASDDHDAGEIYPHSFLFSPLKIRNLKLANRICWASPVEAGKIQAISAPSPEYTAFLLERAANGVSLIFGGRADCFPEEWAALGKELNQLGCRLAAGLSMPQSSRRLSSRRLEKIAAYLANSAKDLCNAGVDAIYLDAAAGTPLGWLLARQDEHLNFHYKRGSSFLIYLTAKVRSAMPLETPLFLRADPVHLGDNLLQNLKNVGLDAALLQADQSFAGSIKKAKALQTAAINQDEDFFIFAEMPSASALPSLCELTLLQGFADALVLSRALLADPSWPSLAYSGRESALNNCILCPRGCAPFFHLADLPGCAVNPRTGKELTRPLKPANIFAKRNLAVIGSGPAGLQAALTAWERGYQVSLFDIDENPFAQYIYFYDFLLENEEKQRAERDFAEPQEDSPAAPANDTAVISEHDENGESFGEGVISVAKAETNEEKAEIEAIEKIEYAEMTIADAKLAIDAEESPEEEKVSVDKESLLEFMAQTASENGNNLKEDDSLMPPDEDLPPTIEEPLETEESNSSVELSEEDTKPSCEDNWPAISSVFDLDQERRAAWFRYSHHMLARMRAAEAAGDFQSFFETEVTLAMLAQSRFDAIIVAAGSENGFEVFQMIQDSYVAPVVRIAGAAAGTEGIGEAIRSGYLVASII